MKYESHFKRLLRHIKKWFLKDLRTLIELYKQDIRVGHEEMKSCIINDKCMLEYGCIGMSTSFILMKDTLFAIAWIIVVLFIVSGLVIFLFTWLCALITYPLYTIPITIVLLLPFVVGCAYGCHIANLIDVNDTLDKHNDNY